MVRTRPPANNGSKFRRGFRKYYGIGHFADAPPDGAARYNKCPVCGALHQSGVVKQGRKPVQINYELLDKLCALQCTGEEIAAFLGLDYNTLADHVYLDTGIPFSEYYAKKSLAGRVSLRRRQWVKAVEEGNVAMLIWLGKQYLGQKDKQEITGKDGGPIEIERRFHLIQEIISSQEARARLIAEWRRELSPGATDQDAE